jgi:hypothetical protein
MLVKQSIVENWYQKDSWVYKNFAYLFQNPLWQKNIPRGFSVCPYFWLNLFSFLIFRPLFVAPIQYVFAPIVKFFGKRGAKVDAFLFRVFQKVGIGRDAGYFTGIGILTTLGVFSSIALAIFLSLVLLVKGQQFHNYVGGSNLGTFFFWSFTSLIGLSGIILGHKKLTKTPCKTLYYLFVWLALFILAAFIFIPSEIGAGIVAAGKGIGWFFTDVIWQVIVYIGLALKWAGWGIGVGLKYVGIYLWKFLTWTPFSAALPFLPWWTYLLGLTVLAYYGSQALNYLGGLFPEPKYEPIQAAVEPEQKRNYRYSWIALFQRVLSNNKYWKESTDLFRAVLDSDTIGRGLFGFDYDKSVKACVRNDYFIYRAALVKVFSSTLDKLEDYQPEYTSKEMDAILENQDSVSDRFAALNTYINSLRQYKDSDIEVKLSKTDIFFAMREVILKDVEVRDYIHNTLKDFERQEKRRANSWSRKTCLAVTNRLAIWLDNAFEGLTVVGRFLVLVKRGLVWLAVQTGTLFAYLWMFAKAKKKGACPYFQFSDPASAGAPVQPPTNTGSEKVNIKMQLS